MSGLIEKLLTNGKGVAAIKIPPGESAGHIEFQTRGVSYEARDGRTVTEGGYASSTLSICGFLVERLRPQARGDAIRPLPAHFSHGAG